MNMLSRTFVFQYIWLVSSNVEVQLEVTPTTEKEHTALKSAVERDIGGRVRDYDSTPVSVIYFGTMQSGVIPANFAAIFTKVSHAMGVTSSASAGSHSYSWSYSYAWSWTSWGGATNSSSSASSASIRDVFSLFSASTASYTLVLESSVAKLTTVMAAFGFQNIQTIDGVIFVENGEKSLLRISEIAITAYLRDLANPRVPEVLRGPLHTFVGTTKVYFPSIGTSLCDITTALSPDAKTCEDAGCLYTTTLTGGICSPGTNTGTSNDKVTNKDDGESSDSNSWVWIALALLAMILLVMFIVSFSLKRKKNAGAAEGEGVAPAMKSDVNESSPIFLASSQGHRREKRAGATIRAALGKPRSRSKKQPKV